MVLQQLCSLLTSGSDATNKSSHSFSSTPLMLKVSSAQAASLIPIGIKHDAPSDSDGLEHVMHVGG